MTLRAADDFEAIRARLAELHLKKNVVCDRPSMKPRYCQRGAVDCAMPHCDCPEIAMEGQ